MTDAQIAASVQALRDGAVALGWNNVVADCDVMLAYLVPAPASNLPADLDAIFTRQVAVPSRCTVFDEHARPYDKYLRYFNRVVITTPTYTFKFYRTNLAGGGRFPFPAVRYDLFIGDGTTRTKRASITLTGTENGFAQINNVDVSAEPDEARLCELVGYDAAGNVVDSDARFWMHFNVHGKLKDCAWDVAQYGSYEMSHPLDLYSDPTLTQYRAPPGNVAWCKTEKTRWGQTLVPLKPRTVTVPITYTSPLTQIGITPGTDEDSLSPFYPVTGRDGIQTFDTSQGYDPYQWSREDAADKTDPASWMPTQPTLDGPRGIATSHHPLWIDIGRTRPDGNAFIYAFEMASLVKWDPFTGAKRTIQGIRHKWPRYVGNAAMPDFYDPPKGLSDPEVELVNGGANWDPSVPVTKRWPRRVWNACWITPGLLPDPASATFGGEHGHSAGAGPFLYAPDQLGRMLRNRLIGRVEDMPPGYTDPHDVPPFVDLALPEGTFGDPFGCCRDPETQDIYVADRKNHTITQWKHAPTGTLPKVRDVYVNTQAQSGVFGAVGKRVRWEWPANLLTPAPFYSLNPNVDPIRDAGIVGPEDLVFWKDPATGEKYLYVSSTAGLCAWRIKLSTGALDFVCDFRPFMTPNGKSFFTRIAIKPDDGTLFMCSFSEVNFSRPWAFKPIAGLMNQTSPPSAVTTNGLKVRQCTHSVQWYYSDLAFNTPQGGSTSVPGRWSSGGYPSAIAVTNERLVYGTSSGNFSMIVATDAAQDAVTFKDGHKEVQFDRVKQRQGFMYYLYHGYPVKYGMYGFRGPYPLTPQSDVWGKDPNCDYWLQTLGHKAP